jgi:hypothetical protein
MSTGHPSISMIPFIGSFTGFFFALAVLLGIWAAICYFVSLMFQRIPAQYREMDPAQVWLLMIPLFNIVWNFFVFPKLSRSYKAYLESMGDTSAGDCEATLAMAYCIVAAPYIIPCVNCFTGLAALVIVIIYLIKIDGLKAKFPPVAQ